MTLPTTGAISLNAIAAEFGGVVPHALNEYYAGGLYVRAGCIGTNGPIPSSGTITFDIFHGASNTAVAQLVFITSGTSYTLPAKWNPANNKIQCIGAGGTGLNFGLANTTVSGGRGGCYSSISNWNIPANTTLTLQVGNTSTNVNTWVSNTGIAPTGTANGCLAVGASTTTTGCIGTTSFAGGSGGLARTSDAGATFVSRGGGGGGAGGPTSAGTAGGQASAGAGIGGAGGSGGSGGSGSGGAGGAGADAATTGGAGGNGTNFDSTHGAGGGGGGSTATIAGSDAGDGGQGGYGGGGGGAGYEGGTPMNGVGGKGGQGLIVISWYT